MRKRGVLWETACWQGSSVFRCPAPRSGSSPELSGSSLQAQATDCWHEQRSWTYLSTRLLPCSVLLHQYAAHRTELAASSQGGGRPEPGCQALKENTTQSFNSHHQELLRGPVKRWFGGTSRQFASFYRLVIWNGSPRGNLECWKLHWNCCGAAQSHLHLTPFCWCNHIPAGVCLPGFSNVKKNYHITSRSHSHLPLVRN